MKMSQMREFFFSLSMLLAMSFYMEYYNLSLNAGGASYPLFIEVLKEVWLITALVFSIQEFFGSLLAERLMFKLTQPEKIPLFMRPSIRRICTVCLMCPTMSVISLILLNIREETSYRPF